MHISTVSINLIGDYAFSSLNNLQVLEFRLSKIEKISKYGFAFREASNKTLVLYMQACDLTESTFADNEALANFKRQFI